MLCMWWMVGVGCCGEQEIVEGGSGMRFGLGASEIFWQLPFFRNQSVFPTHSAALGIFLFKRHVGTNIHRLVSRNRQHI